MCNCVIRHYFCINVINYHYNYFGKISKFQLNDNYRKNLINYSQLRLLITITTTLVCMMCGFAHTLPTYHMTFDLYHLHFSLQEKLTGTNSTIFFTLFHGVSLGCSAWAT